MDEIDYELKIYSQDRKLNINLLKKNIEKYETMLNTFKSICVIHGGIKTVSD